MFRFKNSKPSGFKSFARTFSNGRLTAALTARGPTPQNISQRTYPSFRNSAIRRLRSLDNLLHQYILLTSTLNLTWKFVIFCFSVLGSSFIKFKVVVVSLSSKLYQIVHKAHKSKSVQGQCISRPPAVRKRPSKIVVNQ